MAMHESRIGDLPKIRNFQVAFVSALKLPWVPEVFQVRSVPVPAKSVWETRAKKVFFGGFAAPADDLRPPKRSISSVRVIVKNHSYENVFRLQVRLDYRAGGNRVYVYMYLQVHFQTSPFKLICKWKVLYADSFWNRRQGDFRNGLLLKSFNFPFHWRNNWFGGGHTIIDEFQYSITWMTFIVLRGIIFERDFHSFLLHKLATRKGKPKNLLTV